MPNLEPTYLRYVYDSLNKGSLNAENAAALPRGFIGLYEQEFSHKTPAGERKKVLNQLALWALFKGPVSANMAAVVMELEEEQMKDLVDTYSSWFNSPESGKYQLYHERLRLYLLQKLKAEEMQTINEKLISFLEDAIKQAKGEEDEYYALEHLHQHMVLESQLGYHYERLQGYVNQKSLWSRQIQLSKGYAWSQNAVQQGIKEGARRNHEMNTIRSTVNSVKLMTQEQNSAEDILNLLNEGDYLTALKRAESWEGERQFKLYLLFIHELTIGNSKKADFRKEACKAVLEAIDQTPEDHSVLDWCKFYPEMAIYKYHEELLKMNLDGVVIWKRGKYNLQDLIQHNYSRITILKNLISNSSKKLLAIRTLCNKINISAEKKEIRKLLNQAYRIVEETKTPKIKSETNLQISEILMDLGQKKEAYSFLKESTRLAFKIEFEKDKSILLSSISKAFFQQGYKEESKRIINESIRISNLINYKWHKAPALYEICKALIFRGEKEESINFAFTISEEYEKSKAFSELCKFFIIEGNSKEFLRFASEINHVTVKNHAFADLSKLLVDYGKTKESLRLVSEITNNFEKSCAYAELSKNLLNQRDEQGAKYAVKESILFASKILDDCVKSEAYATLTKILIGQSDKIRTNSILKETIKLLTEIRNKSKSSKNNESLNRAEKLILSNLNETKNHKGFIEVVLNSLVEPTILDYNEANYITYSKISKALAGQHNDEVALRLASFISNEEYKSEALISILQQLIKIGKKKECIKLALTINNNNAKSNAYFLIVKEFGNKLDNNEFVEIIENITNPKEKAEAYLLLAKKIHVKNKVKAKKIILKSIQLAEEMDEQKRESQIVKFQIYLEIIRLLIGHGDNEESKKVATTSLNFANKMNDKIDLKLGSVGNLSTLLTIVKILNNNGDNDEAKKVIKKFLKNTFDFDWKEFRESQPDFPISDLARYFLQLSKIFHEFDFHKEARTTINESLKISKQVIDSHLKSELELAISIGLIDQGEKEKSLRLVSKIKIESARYRAYSQIIDIMMNQGKEKESIKLVEHIKHGSTRKHTYVNIGKKISFLKNINLISIISSKENKTAIIKGISEKINEQLEISVDTYPYLYHHSKYTQNLSNILFYWAKMACFFEEERNEEKLDMLSEVLDLKDWRRISARA